MNLPERQYEDAERSAAQLGWAREQLGVSEKASLAEIQQQLLATVEDEGVVPSESLRPAYQMLRAAAVGLVEQNLPQAYQLDKEAEQLREIQAFAFEMLTQPIPQRQQQWMELYQRCGSSLRARGRLEILRPGLKADLSRVESTDDAVQILCKSLLELFPLPPTQRAVRRRALIADLQRSEIVTLRRAQNFKWQYPDLVALDPALIDELTLKPVRKTLHEIRVAAARKQRRKASSTFGLEDTPWWAIALGLMVLSSLGRLFTNLDNSPSSRQNLPETTRMQDGQQLPTQPDFKTWRSEQGETLPEYLERLRQANSGRESPDPSPDIQPIVPRPEIVPPNVPSPSPPNPTRQHGMMPSNIRPGPPNVRPGPTPGAVPNR